MEKLGSIETLQSLSQLITPRLDGILARTRFIDKLIQWQNLLDDTPACLNESHSELRPSLALLSPRQPNAAAGEAFCANRRGLKIAACVIEA